MWTGTLFALTAGLLWGLVFISPLLLPDYPAALQTFGRYLAFGLIALPLAWLDRARMAQLSRADWLEAGKLGLVGNIIYYGFLSSAIGRAGGPLPTMIIGTLPVVIAISSNLRDGRRDGRLPWARLAPSLLLIGGGIACVNQAELAHLRADPQADLGRYSLGGLLALGALACWTWYPLRNADWLRAHPDRSPRAWATAQGVATLPLALLGYAVFWAWTSINASAAGAPLLPAPMPLPLPSAVPFAMPFAMPSPMPFPMPSPVPSPVPSPMPFPMPYGPRPAVFLGLMSAIGLLSSWLGTLCWNEASQRLPTALVGQLIVFETLAALGYALLLRGSLPAWPTGLGVLLLVAGVSWALRIKREPLALVGHTA